MCGAYTFLNSITKNEWIPTVHSERLHFNSGVFDFFHLSDHQTTCEKLVKPFFFALFLSAQKKGWKVNEQTPWRFDNGFLNLSFCNGQRV